MKTFLLSLILSVFFQETCYDTLHFSRFLPSVIEEKEESEKRERAKILRSSIYQS